MRDCYYSQPHIRAKSPENLYIYSNRSQSCLFRYCVAGQYQDQPGNAECSKCHPGTASNITGLTTPSCHDCAAGRYAPQDGMEECALCPSGQYNIDTKKTVCAKCAFGRASNITGRDSHCDVCVPGKYAAGFGWKECELCPLGGCVRLSVFCNVLTCTNCVNLFCAEHIALIMWFCLSGVDRDARIVCKN